MGRKLVVALVVILVFVAAGTAFALLSGDDDTNSAQGTTTTVASSTSTPSSSTAATTAPTTAVPSTTAAPGPAIDGCGATVGAITAAVDAGVTGARDNAQVDECRLAAVDPSWAGVHLAAKPGADFAAVTVVVHGAGGSWTIVGSGDAACANTPQQVLVDLGVLCSSGGGGGL